MADVKAFHALLDCNNVPSEICVDTAAILKSFERAAAVMGARIVGKESFRFGKESPPGCTAMLLLDQSHISAHAFADKGKMAIDVFYVRDESIIQKAVEVIKAELGLADVKLSVVQRFI